MTDETLSIFSRLRRLQEQNRSNILGVIAQKAMSTFALQQAAPVATPHSYVNVVVYPQDPFVSEPEVRQMNAGDISSGLINGRFQVQDKATIPAQPDAQGNYMYWPGAPEFDQVNSFYYATFTLRMYERYARRELPWSFPAACITIEPHAGIGGNAFYSEQERLLGFHRFEVEGQYIYAAQSADIVSHETAHAILDGMRDLYNESFGLGLTSFHESFGDMSAILVALHDDSLVKRLLEWTGGDLRLNNFVAALAEEVTDRMRSDGKIHGRTVYLRDALNNFRNMPFDQLPVNPPNPEVELGREIHNYSRLFTGAFYDILVGIYEQLRETKADRIGIHRTRDIGGHLLTCAIELGPVGELDYSDVARAFLAADNLLYDGKYADILMKVFDTRQLLAQSEATSYLGSLRQLPDIRLPESGIQSVLGAAEFLEKYVMRPLSLPPDLELTPMTIYKNAADNVFLTYYSHRRMTLQGTQFAGFDGAHIDTFGGLSLAFDQTGRMRSVFYRPVSDEDIRQINILAAELVSEGLVALGADSKKVTQDEPMHLEQGNPLGLWLKAENRFDLQAASTYIQSILVKFPVLFDKLPKRTHNIAAYLAAWREKLNRG
jgi:hypothetical protein